MNVKTFFREKCPSFPLLRKAMTSVKLSEFNRYIIPQTEVAQGEINIEIKASIVKKYASRWSDYTISVDEKIDELIRRAAVYQNRADIDRIKTDMRFCRFAYGFQPDEYLVFHLEEKSMEERQVFVSDIERFRYVYRMNDIIDMGIYFDKYRTYQRFKQYYRREAIEISKPGHFERFQTFVRKHPVFVKKRVGLSKGESVSLINIKECGCTERALFDTLIKQGKHILEEKVEQGAVMAALNPSSVNTVRCITFNTKKGIVIPFCFLKVGQKGSFVDNGGAGGILIGVNVATGCLATDGFDEFGVRYFAHPETGTRFMEFHLPDWQEVLELCVELSACTPTVKYIGWDLAYTEEGWIVIEGNGGGQMIVPQIVWEHGIKAEVDAIICNMELLR